MAAVTGVGSNGRNVVLVAHLIVLMSSSGCSDRRRPTGGGDSVSVGGGGHTFSIRGGEKSVSVGGGGHSVSISGGGNSVPIQGGNSVSIQEGSSVSIGGGGNSVSIQGGSSVSIQIANQDGSSVSIQGGNSVSIQEGSSVSIQVGEEIANLSADEAEIADGVLDRNADKDEVLGFVPVPFGTRPENNFIMELTRRTIRESLDPGMPLEWYVVDAYFSVLQKKAPRYKFVGSYFYRDVEQDAHLYQWDFDVMIFPLLRDDMSWTLGVIDFAARKFLHFGPKTGESTGELPQDFETKMNFYFNMLDVPTVGWEFVHQALEWPQNLYDDGVFTCYLAERLSVGAMNFGNEQIPQKGLNIQRRRIAAKIAA